MAEESDRRPKQRKAYASNANSSLEHRSDEDFMLQLGRKKGRPPKDTAGTMHSGNIAGSLTVSGNSSSSKTVAAILKQAKDHQPPKEVIRGQHQSQGQRKKSKQMLEQSQQSSTLLNQLVKATNSPMGRVGSPSLAVSPAMSPSSLRGVSPLGKDHNHPVTTKSSSLSRDLSPSRITAQMVKVMAETAPTTNAPNLLRSALQGNMPDPMGILSTSKTEGGIVSVVTCTGGSLSNFNPSRKSTLNISNFTQSTNIGSSHQSHTFSKILTNMAGVGGYLGQQSIDSGESKLSCPPISISTVENLLASSDGTIQTVNVSHIPKVTNPGSTNIGTMSAAATSAASPRPSPRSAMEVAQQIKMEANGQKSSAQLAALRPGMQQQLRTQIQSSRSIDAQLAPKQIQAVTSKSQPSTNRSSPKDTDKKDANMPLLAAKLAPAAVPSVVKVSPSVPNQLKQQQHAGDLVSALSAASLQSTISPSLLISSVTKKPNQFSSVNTLTPELKPRFHQQQHSQTQPGLIFNQSKPAQGETNSLSDHSWLLQQSQHQVISTDHSTPGLNLSGGLGEILSGLEKQQSLEGLIQASISGSMVVQSDSSSHARTIAKQLSSHLSPHRVSSSTQSTVAQPSTVGKITQEFVNQATLGGGGLKIGSSPLGTVTNTIPTTLTTQTISKYRLGDSKQTAIDVDMDIGQLQSITGDGATVKAEALSNISSKDVRRNIHSAISHQLLNTALSSAPNSTLAFSTTKVRDSQTPVKSSASLTFHTLQTSSLAHIPKPIMHASPSVSSLSSVPTTTALPPPPDYTPPPPYPLKFGQFQQGQTQQQNTHNKTGQASKQSVQNPFTFPTTGIKLTPEPESQGLVSFSVANKHIVIGNNTENKSSLNQEPQSRFREPKAANMAVGKNDGVIVKQKGATIDAYSLTNVVAEVKTEMNKNFCNHIGEAKEEKKKFQPFNQRISNLSCFPVMNSSYRAAYRSHAVAVQRARAGVITNTAKSLDILRQNLQRSINKELTDIIKRYTEKYFQPALENIKHNNNEPFLGDDHINYVCRQILEEAKSEYICESGRRSITPSDIPDNISESGSLGGRRMFMKRSRISDSDSEKGSDYGGFKRKTVKKKIKTSVHNNSGRVTPNKPYKTGEPIKREGPKWDPERMKPDTLFVMGARANKALGLGNTRGRLYIRHPDIFKYIGDQEDKVWLYEHNLMPATGGKAYMLLLEDIEDLSRSDDYKDSPGLLMHECVGFTVPEWMLVKMKEQMNALRSDSNKRSLSRSPVSDIGESRPKILPFSAFSEANIKEETMVSPADTEDMDFLSTADNDDTQPSSAISPFTVTGGFEDGGSPSPSDLDPIDDPTPAPSMFA